MKIKCPKCHYLWDYTGSMQWATCPYCMNKIEVSKNKTDKTIQDERSKEGK